MFGVGRDRYLWVTYFEEFININIPSTVEIH